MSKIVERKPIIDVKSPEIVEKTSEIDDKTSEIDDKTSEIDDQTDEMDNCDLKKIFSATFDLLAAESVTEMVIIKYIDL
jgi:hypothetical protein